MRGAHRRSSGNTSIEREGHDEIGPRRRPDPECIKSNRASGAGTCMIRQKCDRTISHSMVVGRAGGPDPSYKVAVSYSFCQMSITPSSRAGTDDCRASTPQALVADRKRALIYLVAECERRSNQ